MQLLIPARRNNRQPKYFRLRFEKSPHADGVFISKKELLVGVLLLTLSILALQWIVSSAMPTARETPVAASSYRT
jgi:hypothetical protein